MSVPYLSAAYYRALLAEARGEPVVESTEAICDGWAGDAAIAQAAGGQGLAVLHDPADDLAPSDERSVRHLLKLAAANGLRAAMIGPGELERLGEFDALWIRSHTSPVTTAYRFARRAERLGLPVIDDPASIRHCGNKAFLAERFRTCGVAAPRTLLVDSGTPVSAIEAALAYPIVVKVPDGSFSSGVFKAEHRTGLAALLDRVLERSAIAVVQEFIPTAFDWRVCLLDGELVFACQYRMARNHWQILKYDGAGPAKSGPYSTVPADDLPPEVLALARRAAASVGQGLYGVDIKHTGNGPLAIEVNDNPDLYLGVEDRAEGDAPWLKILSWFSTRMMMARTGTKTSHATVRLAEAGSAR